MPRALVTQSRNFVIKVYEYFERESQNGGPLLPVTRVGDRAAAALGINPKTISKILKEKYGASGMEDNELTTPGNTRLRKTEDLTKSVDSTNDSEDEYLIPVKQSKISTAHQVSGQTVNNITKDDINGKQNRKYKSVKTDHKRHAFFAVEYSETSAKDIKPLAKTESQKSVKPNTSEAVSLSGLRINIGLLNTLTDTEPWHDESNNLSATSDPLTNRDDSVDFDALNTLVDPALLVTQDNVTTDPLIPIKQEKIEESNCTTYLDEDEKDHLTIVKLESEQDNNVGKPSSGKTKLVILQKIQSSKTGNLGTVQKSIAKADFKVGRLKVSGIVNKNVIYESEKDKICQPVAGRSKPSTGNKINIDAIRKHVQEYHRKNQVPTIRILLKSLKEAGLFNGSKDTLLKIMAQIGLKLKFKSKTF